MLTADDGVSSPARICGTRFCHIQELPADSEITLYSVSGSAPARMPSASASAAVAMCTPASNWFTILTVLPTPISSPRRQTLVEIASKTGPALANAASDPDPITGLVANLAPPAPQGTATPGPRTRAQA